MPGPQPEAVPRSPGGRPPATRGGGGEEGTQGCPRHRRPAAPRRFGPLRGRRTGRGAASHEVAPSSDPTPQGRSPGPRPLCAPPPPGALPSARAAQPERPPAAGAPAVAGRDQRGRRLSGKGRGFPPVSPAAAGNRRPSQNWHGPGESDCLIKTKQCDGR